jgi:hypothetical protein
VRSEATPWVPALAALGDAFARSDPHAEPGEAIVVIPVLIAVGADATTPSVGSANAPGSGAATLETRNETERWVPAFAFTSGMIGQNGEGSVNSNSTVSYSYFAQDTGLVISHVRPGPPSQTPVLVPLTTVLTRSLSEGKGERFTTQSNVNDSLIVGVLPALTRVLPTADKDLFLTPTVGASLELMTPGLQQLAGRPRLFAHAGAAAAFSFDRNTAKEGIPGDVEFPAPGLRFGEGEIKGIGSKTSGEVQTLVLSAGLGTAFTLDAFERRLRIKPSLEWMRQEIKVSGQMVRVYRKDTGTGTGTGTPQPAASFFLQEPIDLQTDDTLPFHGIGPGLEVEMDAGRAGPVVLSLFLSGQAYYMLGDREVHLTGTDQITDPAMVPNTQSVSADFDFNIHQWSYQGGLGIRFRWVPED